jgi:glycosyltransferase involved in cell wall biosynthesis
MKVAIIATVRNEAHSIGRLLESIGRQTYEPHSIVISDGGSVDGTVDVIRSFQQQGLPITIISAPGTNISMGRNLAIAAAQTDLIASTDAGVWLEPQWLAELVTAYETAAGEGEDVVVSGFFVPDPHTPFEAALGATILPALEDVRPSSFLPSSRSVLYPRALWERVGGYPRWLDYGEDLVFDLALRRAGARFVFAPRAIAHFRPRPSLRAFARQYYLYARGDGKADLWRYRHAIRYTVYTVAPLAMVAGIWYKVLWIALVLAAAAYCRRPYQRLLPYLDRYPWPERLYALAVVPLIRLIGDVAKMMGYPVGVWWRLHHPVDYHESRPERHHP